MRVRSHRSVLSCAHFLRDVSKHEMTIIRDDGFNRHLRFKRPDTISMYFDLITWKGHLCYTGDMGTYVFSRIEDMFEFFRRNPKADPKWDINPCYWAEKLKAIDRHGGVTEWSERNFRKAVNQTLFTSHPSKEMREKVKFEVLAFADNEHEAMRAVYEFGDPFIDFHEHDLHEHTLHYIWCCRALVWAINRYDASKQSKEAA